MTATWKVAPCLALGNTAVLKMSELSPLTATRLGELALEAGVPPGVLNVVHGYGRDRRRGARPASGRARDLVHRRHGDRQPDRAAAGLKKFSMELGGKSPFVVFDDADLDRALDAAVFMIFSQQRRALHGRLAHPRAADGLRPVRRGSSRRARRASRSAIRSTRRPIIGPMISPRASGQGAALHRARPTEGATLLTGGLDAPDRAARVQQAATSCGRRCSPTSQPDAHRAGRDLRAGRVPDPVRRRGRRAAHRQRRPVRAVVVRVDARTSDGASPRRGHRGRHVLRQQPERARPAPAVRRHQGVGHRPRGRRVELRGVLRAEERLRVARRPSRSRAGASRPRWASSRSPPRSRTCRRCTCRSCPARTTAAGRRPSTATSRSAGAAARSAWTRSSCSTCTGSSTPATTSTARRRSRASTRSNELPHFIKNMPYDYSGQSALGQLIAETATERRRQDARARRHHARSRVRHAGADALHERRPALQGRVGGRVVQLAQARRQRAFRRGRRAARSRSATTARSRSSPAARCRIASTTTAAPRSRSTRSAASSTARSTCAWSSCGSRATGRRFVDDAARVQRRRARARATCTTRRCCWGCSAGTRYDRPVEIITPYFASSGTGQINAVFPVTPLAALTRCRT